MSILKLKTINTGEYVEVSWKRYENQPKVYNMILDILIDMDSINFTNWIPISTKATD